MKRAIKLARLAALAGSILTLVQIILLAGDWQGICLNDGCEIVDNLTVIPPIFFNIAGLLFFQAMFWGGMVGR